MGKFGWSLPPGVTTRMIDEAYGVEGPCECCGKMVDDCICEECSICNSYGDPDCYKNHGMKFTPEQLAGQAELEEYYREERKREDAMYQEYLKDEKYFGELEDKKVQAMSILDEED